MKLQFRYEPNADEEYPCCARTEYQGKDYFGIGRDWEHAKGNLLKKVNVLLGAKVPPPETIDVKVASDEMDTELLPWEDKFDKVAQRIIEPGTV